MTGSILPDFLDAVPPLLLAGAGAILAAVLGGLLVRRLPMSGRLLRIGGNLVLFGVLALAVLRFARLDPSFDALLPQFGMPVQRVAGGETRVPLSSDGHFWIEARVNGTSQRFMVDTGATVSALSTEAARKAGVEPDPMRLPVMVRTANGTVPARLGTIAELRFGNITASELDTLITGETGGLNVLGMNFLSRLKGWRVENGELILSPVAAMKGGGD